MNFPVRMVHEEHGAMHVYDQAQLERCAQRGWIVEEPVVVDQPKKKRGRPKKVST